MSGSDLLFEPLYFEDRLGIVNPAGDVGVVTLWTPRDTALKQLEEAGLNLDSAASRIAVVANLYGDGLPQMIRNLLWNPSLHHILIYGQDLSNSAAELEAFLLQGVEDAEQLGHKRFRIIGTNRMLDTGFPPDILPGNIAVTRLGKPGAETFVGIRAFFDALPEQRAPQRERIAAPLPEYKPEFYPSEPAGHVVVRPRPLDCWEDVVARIMRYGVPGMASRTKKRLELQNLKVVVTGPAEEKAEHLAVYGFDLEDFRAYQRAILDPELPADLSYSYGNRMRGYWQDPDSGETIDCLECCARQLADDETGRGAYVSLWDSRLDLGDPGAEKKTKRSKPCLVTLFFRMFQGRLTLTATFRAHNTMSAWLRNCYGLMAIRDLVAGRAAELSGEVFDTGPITIISHSISIDPGDTGGIEKAQQILAERKDDKILDRDSGKRELPEDPMGYFVFTVDHDAGEIVADLKYGGDTLTRYRGSRAKDIERQITRDNAISLLSHALYAGRQLTLMEQQLKAGKGKAAG